MKKLLMTISAGLALAAMCQAQVPSYTTKAGAGNTTAGASVFFPADPQATIRLVSLQYQADTNTTALAFSSGGAVYTLLATNTTTGLTQRVASTSGLITNSLMVLQHNGTNYGAVLTSTNNGTNAVLISGAWGVAPSIGDNMYQMGASNSVPVGNVTNWINGEALFVGNRGRPVQVQLVPCLTTNRITSATVRYD